MRYSKIQEHFSSVSLIYRRLRKTDKAPVNIICKRIKDLPYLMGADIGCGTGRYDKELLAKLGRRLFLICIDLNKNMLLQLRRYLGMCRFEQFAPVRSLGCEIPIASNSLDFVLTFNAVHHFDLEHFIKESGRILKKKRYLFAFTRLKSQNERNIWGMYFPSFCDKEDRLYEVEDCKEVIARIPSLMIMSVKYFVFKRISNLRFLMKLARSKHYSTFCLYGREEFEGALRQFEANIKNNFRNPKRVTWTDEYAMFIIRKM